MENDVKRLDVKNIVFRNLFWRFLERCGAQVVTLIVSIVLARILDPQVYGIVAIVTVIINILQVFVDSGLGNALIQKKNADKIDFSTVFYVNIVFCVLLYIGIFIAAPYIALFYEKDILTNLVRVLSLVILVSGVRNVQQAYVAKNMLFKKYFYSTIGGTVVAAVVGISMAYLGYGVWALVAQQLFNVTISTIILWFTVKWRPVKAFSWQRLKNLYSFSWKLLVSNLIGNLYQNLIQLIIGKTYTSTDLAYYNRGQQFPQLIITNINTTIDSVLLPTMSEEQENREKIKNMMRRSMKMSMFVIAPMMVGLVVIAPSFVKVVLTEKWLPCVPYMQIFCIAMMFLPMCTANLNAINAMGRSDIYLKLEIIKRVVGIILLIISMQINVMAMAYSYLLGTLIGQVINAWPNKILLGYELMEQIKDIIPSIILSGVMGIFVWTIGFFSLPDIVTLCLQILTGTLIYVFCAKLFKVEIFEYLLEYLKSFKLCGKKIYKNCNYKDI